MFLKKSVALLSAGLLSVGILAACNSDSSSGTAGDAGSSGGEVIKIAAQLPLSGSTSVTGESLRLGAQMKLEEEQAKFKDLGFDLKFEPYDDASDPKKGVSNANMIVADESILAIVGHYNSGVAIPSSEVYDKSSLAMVSPGATATDLTDRGLKTVNRIVGRDDAQGPAAAEFMVNELGVKNLFIIQDKTAFGTGVAEEVKKKAESLGATVVAFEGITVGEKDFNGVINQVLSKKPDAVYFGGLYTEAGIIVKQMREKGIDIPFVGADALDSSGLVDIAGDAVVNTYYTSVAGVVSSTETGKEFVKNYEAKFSGKKAEAFSVYGYDTMGVILAGVEKAIADNGGKKPSREQVAEAIRATTDFQGALASVSFDDKGDNSKAQIYLFKFEEAAYPGTLVK